MAGKLHRQAERLQRLILGQEEFLGAMKVVLATEEARDGMLRAQVFGGSPTRFSHVPGLDPDRVFNSGALRSMCIRYRSRFLPAGGFKGSLTLQTMASLRDLERYVEGQLGGFMIMAPARCFRRSGASADPLLFMRVGTDAYYLVHRSGDHPTWRRAIIAWPFRTPVTLAITVLILASLLAAVMPNTLITSDPAAGWWGAHRLLMLFWSVMVTAAFTVFGWFTFFGWFSRESWNDPHLR